MAEINDGKKGIKVIAFYLPQFHAIPENDKAWGEGFTEWTNVKKAYPYFKGHYQPRIPLNENYYNLLDKKVQEWQVDLAKQYNVFGFCYYHYWFKNGKKLLEKPAENMLQNNRCNQPFCFCWANENWTKTWTGGDDEIIAFQDYGSEEDWKNHFDYLLPFFKDERYITLNGCPVLVIYKPELIPKFSEMISYFKKIAVKNGFKGLEVMIQFPNYIKSSNYEEKSYDHYIDFEPVFSIDEVRESNVLNTYRTAVITMLGNRVIGKLRSIVRKSRKYSYDEIWERILNRKYPNDKFICGAFTDWDNSPRKRRSVLFTGASPEKFKYYFGKLVEKIYREEKEKIIFLNAWNEWGEGAYLEPDEKYEYAYLEAVKSVVEGSMELS